MTTTKIVTVWLDRTSDEHGWIVDTDTPEGGESDTLKTFPPTKAGKVKAVAYARKVADRRGLELRIAD